MRNKSQVAYPHLKAFQLPNTNYRVFLRGFTFIELLVLVAVGILMASIVVVSLSSFRENAVVKNTATDITAFLQEARSATLSSKNEDVYGVHILADKMYLFKGSSFSVSDPNNKLLGFSSLVTVTPTYTDVIFDRLTGKTAQFGTITVELNSDASQTRTITVYQTGLAESS